MLILYAKIYALSQGRQKQISKLQEPIHDYGRKRSSIFPRVPQLSITTDDTQVVESESESETVTGSIQLDAEAETLIALPLEQRLTTSFGSYGSISRPSIESTRRQSFMPGDKAYLKQKLTPAKRLSQSMKIPRSQKLSKVIRHQKAYSLRPPSLQDG
uniref:Uncharacterized protein n=1 Tax=Romanomermis culicivorax TaxID=13658 RepID=A0A915L516_ROMCU